MGDRGLLRGRIVSQSPEDRVPFPQRPAKHSVGEAGGVIGPGFTDQAHCLIDRRVIGGAVGVEQLEDAEPKGCGDRRVRSSSLLLGEIGNHPVRGPSPLDRTESESLGLGPGPAGEFLLDGDLAERGFGVLVLFERAAENGEGNLPLGSDPAHVSRPGTELLPRPLSQASPSISCFPGG